MKIETIYPDDVLESIAIRQKNIEDIQMQYLAGVDPSSAMGFHKAKRAAEDMKSDCRIKLLEKEIADIYIRAVPRINLIAETAQEEVCEDCGEFGVEIER